jgi:hypothetical protein
MLKYYILPKLLDLGTIQKYSSTVILDRKPDTFHTSNMCVFIEENVHVYVRVNLLHDGAYLLHFAQDHPLISLYKMLSIP